MFKAVNNLKERKGFTLIELLIVVAIIGILAAIAIPAFLGQREKAKVKALQASLDGGRKEVSSWLGSMAALEPIAALKNPTTRVCYADVAKTTVDTDGNGSPDTDICQVRYGIARSATYASALDVATVFVSQHSGLSTMSPYDQTKFLFLLGNSTTPAAGQVVVFPNTAARTVQLLGATMQPDGSVGEVFSYVVASD